MSLVDDPTRPAEAGSHPYVPSRFFMAHVVNPITLWLGGPTLTVRGRRTGRPIRTPVPTLEVGGARYLVSGGGSLLVFDAADQSALYGLLARLRNAGIELVAVHRIVAPAEKRDGGARTDISPMEVPGVTR